jgi:hypothetical protein
MKNALFLIFVFASMSCSETSDQPISTSLEGKWVDLVTKTDTLEFLKFDDGNTLMLLHRAKEISNGQKIPKIGAGPYTYSLSGSRITLQYSLSSFYGPTDYFFEQNGLQLRIGRFFESGNSASILTFKKVE